MKKILSNRKTSYKKAGSAILSLLLLISMSGCGNGNNTAEDYSIDNNNQNEYVINSNENDSTDSNDSYETMKDFFGDSVIWEDSYTIDNIDIQANVKYKADDSPLNTNVYTIQKVSDGKDEEEEIVNSIFGDSATKLEELKYVNETDYISFLYRYRDILKTYNAYQGDTTYYTDSVLLDDVNVINLNKFDLVDVSIIDENFTDIYKWIDKDDFYIHMYEGTYNDIRYGLILAYNSNTSSRYIFFNPISIKEYYPEENYQSLIYKNISEDMLDKVTKENKCQKSLEEIKTEAYDFLTNNIHMSINEDNISYIDKGNYSSLITGQLAYVFNIFHDSRTPAATILSFSDVDYVSSLDNTAPDSYKVGYQILTKQKELIDVPIDEDIFPYIREQDYGPTDTPQFSVDGYALFLTEEFDSSGNNGIIKITDKGIFGLDLEYKYIITDVSKNVNLLEFDKIKESFNEQAPALIEDIKNNEYNNDVVNANIIEIGNIKFANIECNNSDDSTTYSVPCWVFSLHIYNSEENTDYSGLYTDIFINAIDGSLIDTENK
ncbi:MAG: hypothetical protein K6E10_03575 [Eubacterium sp.]|nr:hypothetical protein [Eubacterium sp.]